MNSSNRRTFSWRSRLVSKGLQQAICFTGRMSSPAKRDRDNTITSPARYDQMRAGQCARHSWPSGKSSLRRRGSHARARFCPGRHVQGPFRLIGHLAIQSDRSVMRLEDKMSPSFKAHRIIAPQSSQALRQGLEERPKSVGRMRSPSGCCHAFDRLRLGPVGVLACTLRTAERYRWHHR